MATREQILAALKAIVMPGSSEDIVSAGLVSDIAIADGAVMFAINVDPARARGMEPVRWPPRRRLRLCRASARRLSR